MQQNPRNPYLTVDIIIETQGGIVLIERKNSPFGWALPGGFVDYGETLESAACREAREETSLSVTLIEQFHTYSDPARDPRHHTVSTVFIARAEGQPQASDDAKNAAIFQPACLPDPIAFDHARIIHDYLLYRKGVQKNDIFRFSA
jgi:8-oxo-dGTP diphosphatase